MVPKLKQLGKLCIPPLAFVLVVLVGELAEPYRDRLLASPLQQDVGLFTGLALLLVWFTDSVQARARYLSHGRLIHPAQVLASFSIGTAGFMVGLSALQVMGIAIAANFVFQLFVNSAYPNIPLIDPDEQAEYDLRIFGRTLYVPKFFAGNMRYFQVPIGVFLFIMESPSFPFPL